jgi:hypothetical protein
VVHGTPGVGHGPEKVFRGQRPDPKGENDFLVNLINPPIFSGGRSGAICHPWHNHLTPLHKPHLPL